MSTTLRGDHFVGEPATEYLVRLWGEESAAYGILWIDVAIYQVHYVSRTPDSLTMYSTASIPASAQREYDMPTSPDRGERMTANPEEAVAICEGFVRSETCTQLRFDRGLQVDGTAEMGALCHALQEAQRLALALMHTRPSTPQGAMDD